MAAFGGVGVAVGTSAKAAASTYFASYGNYYPAIHTASGAVADRVGRGRGANAVNQDTINRAGETAEELLERGHEGQCRPD